MAGTRASSAGIHLDGQVATLVLLSSTGKATDVRQAQGFTALESLQRLLPLVDANVALRVSFSTDGLTAQPVDLTPAMLTRTGFDTAARRAFGSLPSTSVLAGVVADPDQVAAGQLSTALAIAAPGDVVGSLYRALSSHPGVEVTATAATHGALDGLHLSLRRANTELTFVRAGVPLLTRLLPAGGSDALAARLSSDATAAAAVLAGADHDPAAAHLIRSWLADVVAQVTTVRKEWSIDGYDTGTSILVSGKSAGAAALDELLSTAGLTRNPHPLVSLPHPAPLDAVDAYLAAASAGTRLPLSVFENSFAVPAKGNVKFTKTWKVSTAPAKTRTRKAPSKRTRAALASLAAALVVAGLGAAGYTTWDRYNAAGNADTAAQVAQTRDEVARGAEQARLNPAATAAQVSKLVLESTAGCTDCAAQVDVTGTGAVVRTTNIDVPALAADITAAGFVVETAGTTLTVHETA